MLYIKLIGHNGVGFWKQVVIAKWQGSRTESQLDNSYKYQHS